MYVRKIRSSKECSRRGFGCSPRESTGTACSQTRSERSLEAGDIVDLVLTDTGGIARTANPWLDGVDGECTAKLCGAQGVTIEFARFAGPNGAFQSTIKPSALELAKRIGGDRVTLCQDRPVQFTIEIVDRRDEASSR